MSSLGPPRWSQGTRTWAKITPSGRTVQILPKWGAKCDLALPKLHYAAQWHLFWTVFELFGRVPTVFGGFLSNFNSFEKFSTVFKSIWRAQREKCANRYAKLLQTALFCNIFGPSRAV